jgi:uncharacterized protein
VIERPRRRRAIVEALTRNPIAVLAGPRQCGKTTLARTFLPETSLNYFDLEDPVSLARLDQPMTALGTLEGLVVIDEIQRRPDLFPVLRVLADRSSNRTQFLVLGSASGDLLRQSSESLAGRAETVLLSGFALDEVDDDAESALWFRGGFPRAFLATSDADSHAWCTSFMSTLLERDFPQWGVRVPPEALRRFWTMVAHFHGGVWKAADPARALNLSESTMRRYLDLLTQAFMVRQLTPYAANLRKRQVKSPKIYIRDTGLLHALLGIHTMKDLLTHPKIGASWEGFVIEQVLSLEPHDEAFFWATHQGAEIDLILHRGHRRLGIEVKRADAPKMSKSISVAMEDLRLDGVVVLYPGSKPYFMAPQVKAVPLAHISRDVSLFDALSD